MRTSYEEWEHAAGGRFRSRRFEMQQTGSWAHWSSSHFHIHHGHRGAAMRRVLRRWRKARAMLGGRVA